MRKNNSWIKAWGLIAIFWILFSLSNPILADESGWCCINGKVVATTPDECKLKGMRYFSNRIEAEKYCRDASQGYCCLNGTVKAMTMGECEKNGGKFFTTQLKADQYCKRHPSLGWCCINGKVVQAAAEECRLKGGQFFAVRHEAEKYCENVSQGFCCQNGTVKAMSKGECEKNGGNFFATQLAADQYCKQHPPLGWCCINGRVVQATAEECKLKGGRFFIIRNEAEKYCQNQEENKWKPIEGVIVKNLKLFVPPAQIVSDLTKSKDLVNLIQKLIHPDPKKLYILANPGHAPIPAAPGCTPTVYMWSTPASDPRVFFNDQEIILNYSVDCATSVSVGNLDFYSTAEALSWAESGVVGDHPANAIFYADAAAAGVLTGSRTYPPGSLPSGLYLWYIGANNNLNPGSSGKETLVFLVITRPAMGDACAPYRNYIEEQVRSIAPRIAAGITNKTSLDAQVEAFRDHILARQTIGLRLQREIELMSSRTQIECTTLPDGVYARYSEAEPNKISLDFKANGWPSAYAILHELTHKVGFNTQLIQAYMNAGLWPTATPGTPEYNAYKTLVEQMTAVVAAAAF